MITKHQIAFIPKTYALSNWHHFSTNPPSNESTAPTLKCRGPRRTAHDPRSLLSLAVLTFEDRVKSPPDRGASRISRAAWQAIHHCRSPPNKTPFKWTHQRNSKAPARGLCPRLKRGWPVCHGSWSVGVGRSNPRPPIPQRDPTAG